jgi:hypothetical protein
MDIVSSTSPSSSSSAIGSVSLPVSGLAPAFAPVLPCHQKGDHGPTPCSWSVARAFGMAVVLHFICTGWDVVDCAAFRMDTVVFLRLCQRL